MSIHNQTLSAVADLAHFRHFSSLFTDLRSTPVENIRQITTFYAKQTQFYSFLARKRRFHEKTNPIQTQFKANLTQNKPNLIQNKANSNPILSAVGGLKMNINTFLTMTLILLLAIFTTIKGTNFKLNTGRPSIRNCPEFSFKFILKNTPFLNKLLICTRFLSIIVLIAHNLN